jgi:hypothetical protein
LVLELIDVLRAENTGHGAHIFVRTPMFVEDIILFLVEGILRAADNTEVRESALVYPDWHFFLEEDLMVHRVLHLLDDDTLFHLADVLLLDDAHQVVESAVDEVWVEIVALLHAHGHESLAALLRKDGHLIRGHGVDHLSEAEFSLDLALAFLALIYALLEGIGVFLVEKKRETGNQLGLGGFSNLHLVLALLLVVGEYLDRFPAILTLIKVGGHSVVLIGASLAPCNPFLGFKIGVPSVVAGEGLNGLHKRVSEDLILFVKDSKGLAGGLVLVEDIFIFR